MTRRRDSSRPGAAPESPRSQSGRDDRLRVLIADADGLARGAMRFALRNSDRTMVVHAVGNGREALELAGYYRPHVAIVDAILPPKGGIEIVRALRLAVPDMRVVTVSSVNDERTAIAALRAGAVGHLGKDIDPAGLAESVARAAEGEVIISQWLMPALLEALRDVPDSGWRPLRSRLTTREWEIVELLGEGATTQRIAERLVLSPMTVYSHTKSILRKLGVNSRRDAVKAAELLRREEALGRAAT